MRTLLESFWESVLNHTISRLHSLLNPMSKINFYTLHLAAERQIAAKAWLSPGKFGPQVEKLRKVPTKTLLICRVTIVTFLFL